VTSQIFPCFADNIQLLDHPDFRHYHNHVVKIKKESESPLVESKTPVFRDRQHVLQVPVSTVFLTNVGLNIVEDIKSRVVL